MGAYRRERIRIEFRNKGEEYKTKKDFAGVIIPIYCERNKIYPLMQSATDRGKSYRDNIQGKAKKRISEPEK